MNTNTAPSVADATAGIKIKTQLPKENEMNTNTLPQVPTQIAVDTVTGATEKQIAFMDKLMAKVAEKVEGITSTEAQGALAACKAITDYRSNGGVMSKRQASALIDTLIKLTEMNYGTPVTPATQPAFVPKVPAPLGIYRQDDKIYCVRKARQSERVYAYQLILINGREPRWEYVAGKVYDLKVEDMISLEVAQEYGRKTGICCICGRFLTDEESVTKGIGPVCERKYATLYSNRHNQ
jgi:hypothetical protein